MSRPWCRCTYGAYLARRITLSLSLHRFLQDTFYVKRNHKALPSQHDQNPFGTRTIIASTRLNYRRDRLAPYRPSHARSRRRGPTLSDLQGVLLDADAHVVLALFLHALHPALPCAGGPLSDMSGWRAGDKIAKEQRARRAGGGV